MPDPEEPGWKQRRPDFERGNTLAVRHGTRSVRLLAPLAEEIKQTILADQELPDYIRQPMFRMALDAFCFAEAQCVKMRDYLAELDLEEAMTDTTVTDETEDSSDGHTDRHSTSRRRESAQEQARRWEAHAANLRSKLGLDPAAAAKLGRNLAAAYDSAKHVMAVRAVWDGKDDAK